MSKVDGLLKTLQVRSSPLSPPEALVTAYLTLIADRSPDNFRKILELKGVRKQEHSSFLEIFNAHSSATRFESLPFNSPILTSLQITTAPQLASLNAATSMGTPKFDAATFGSALMNVAREGVDRFGSPGIGASSGHTRNDSDTSSPMSAHPSDGLVQSSNLNENLKSIGKFFKSNTGSGSFGRWGK
jgi:vacuolar protein sorting-associated protein 53